MFFTAFASFGCNYKQPVVWKSPKTSLEIKAVFTFAESPFVKFV